MEQGGSRVLARRVVLSQVPKCEGPGAHGTRLGTEMKKEEVAPKTVQSGENGPRKSFGFSHHRILIVLTLLVSTNQRGVGGVQSVRGEILLFFPD